MASTVSLGGVTITIEGKIKKQQTAPWNPKLSMGTQEFADYQPASVREWSDVRGGIGLEREEAPTDRLEFSYGIETTKAKYISLGPLKTVLGAFTTPLLLGADFEGATYFFGNSVSQYNNAGSLAAADASPLATPTDVIVFTDATDTYLIYCNGSDVRYASVGYGGSKDWAALSTSDVKFMCAFDHRLIGVDAAGRTIYYSARDNCDDAAGGAMSSFNISGPWSAVYDMFSGQSLVIDDEIIYLITDIGMVTLDFFTRAAYLTELTWGKTASALKGMYWNASVFAATGSGISKVDRNVSNDNWGPDADDGLPSGYTGYVYDLIGLTYWQVIAISGGTNSSILKRQNSVGGWHQVYSSATDNIRAIHHSNLTTPSRLYFGEANNICYVDFPDISKDITKVSGYDYVLSGIIDFPKISKVSTIPKVALEIQALTEDCDIVTSNHNEKIEVYIRRDDTTSWGSAVGTFSTDGRPTPIKLGATAGEGLEFYDIQLRAKLYRGTASTEVSPKLKSLALFFKASPPPIYSWTFNMAARGMEAQRLLTSLATFKETSTMLKFYPDGDTRGTAKWVHLESMPSVLELDNIGQEQKLTVVVSEVVHA